MTFGVDPITHPPHPTDPHPSTTTGRAMGGGIPKPPPPPAPSMGPVRWGAPVGIGYLSGPPPLMGIGYLVLSYTTIHVFTAVMQGLVVVLVVAALPPPSPAAPAGKVATFSLLHLRVVCGVSGD